VVFFSFKVEKGATEVAPRAASRSVQSG
jgi:hypothetical protein